MKIGTVAPVLVCVILLSAAFCLAGGPRPTYMPAPLDESLMAFKEQGVWYFLCEAPMFPYRIPVHYQTYGPPPPCGPPAHPGPQLPPPVGNR